MPGFDHAMILSPSFHGLRKERLAQWSPNCVYNTSKNPGGTSTKIGWGCAARFLKLLLYFRPKSVISLPYIYFWPDQKFDTLFQTWSPGARRVTGARDNLLRHLHRWRKHEKRNGRISKWWRSSFFLKTCPKFKTRVHKPYPISDQNGRNWYPISDQNG